MNLKKTIIPLFLVFMVAMSISFVAADDSTDEGDFGILNVHEVNDTYTNAEIQTVINDALVGDTIYFKEGTYNNMSFSITKTVHIVGDGINKTNFVNSHDSGVTVFLVRAGSGSSIDGTSFYGMSFSISQIYDARDNATEDWYGRVIDVTAGKNMVFDTLFMANGNAGIRLAQNGGNSTIKNSFFTGVTNYATVGVPGVSEQGTKSVNIMGGSNINIYNNTFYGPALDGVSIASGASNINVYNNTFSNNTYGIYFGGGLINITVKNNLFENIDVYAVGLQKSASFTEILNNTFILPNESIAIYLEQGNTAHGYETDIGEVYIDGNKFTAAPGANPFSINAVLVVGANGPLKVNGALEVTNSVLTGGIKLFEFVDASWANGSDIIIKPDVFTTTISGNNVSMISTVGNEFEVVVKDDMGRVMVGKTVTFTINGVSYNRTTNANGVAGLPINLNAGNYTITATFLGDSTFKTSTQTYTISVLPGMTQFIGENYVFNEVGHMYRTQLVDAAWRPIAGVAVSITINGMEYYSLTDSNGFAELQINLNPGSYSLFSNFDGTLQYKPTTGGNQVVRT